MSVVGYTRVNTEEQAWDGVSRGAQKDKIHAYAMAKD
jgi:DNA invertase Pin-like site-specific DNA recombinase